MTTGCYGLDVSNNNGPINWAAVPTDYRFAYLKASEGTGFTDAYYAHNAANARAHGLYVGAYHFMDTEDPIAQARHFAGVVGRTGPGFLPPILDFEGPVLALGRSEGVRRIASFLKEVDRILGVRCGIYLSDSTIDFLGSAWPSLTAGRMIWDARYSSSPPVHGCHIWQFNAYGTVAGVGTGGVDIDLFLGSPAQLAAWAGVAPAKGAGVSAHIKHMYHLAKIGKLSAHLLHLLHVGKPV